MFLYAFSHNEKCKKHLSYEIDLPNGVLFTLERTQMQVLQFSTRSSQTERRQTLQRTLTLERSLRGRWRPAAGTTKQRMKVARAKKRNPARGSAIER